jgi:hypothetical protein
MPRRCGKLNYYNKARCVYGSVICRCFATLSLLTVFHRHLGFGLSSTCWTSVNRYIANGYGRFCVWTWIFRFEQESANQQTFKSGSISTGFARDRVLNSQEDTPRGPPSGSRGLIRSNEYCFKGFSKIAKSIFLTNLLYSYFLMFNSRLRHRLRHRRRHRRRLWPVFHDLDVNFMTSTRCLMTTTEPREQNSATTLLIWRRRLN